MFLSHEELSKIEEHNELALIQYKRTTENHKLGSEENIVEISLLDNIKLVKRIKQLEEFLMIEDKVVAELREENNKLKGIKEEPTKQYDGHSY